MIEEKKIDVSVIIVNYNTFQLTCNCIQSIIDQTRDINYEIILVDNGSSECDPELFRKNFPGIKLVISLVNTGFSKGNNLGIAQAEGEHLLLLNSDTILIENSIKITYDKYKKMKNPGFAGIKTLYPDLATVQPACEQFPTLKNLLFSFFFISRIFGLTKRYRKLDRDFSPEALWGSYLFFDRKLLSHFPGGKLNEMFFMYGEDILWCWEAKKAGFCNYFIEGTKFVHLYNGSQSDKTVKHGMTKHYYVNLEKLEKLINGKWGYKFYVFVKRLVQRRQRLIKPRV